MSNSTDTMNRLSCLIPLYKSERFYSIIAKNIDEHLDAGGHIIVADRHLLDATASKLVRRYYGNSSVRVIAKDDQGDWVDNINGLIGMVETDFFRIVPHDDSVTAESSARLIQQLSKHPKAILSCGVIHAQNLWGLRLRKKDELNAHDKTPVGDWTPEEALRVYWEGLFAGAFKGIVRNSAVKQHKLYIEKTSTLVHSERTWLFALALVGAFTFDANAVLKKRYYSSSTQRTWNYSSQTTLDAANVMAAYCDQLIKDPALALKLKFNTYNQALISISNTAKISQTKSTREKIEIIT